MTWEHLQELRELARRRIAERVALLQPRAGDGVVINGNVICLEPGGGRDAETRRRLLVTPPGRQRLRMQVWLFMLVEWSLEGVDAEGNAFQSEGRDADFRLGAIYHPNKPLEIVDAAWRECFIWDLKPLPGGLPYPRSRRRITIRFATRMFRREEPISMAGGRWPGPVKLELFKKGIGTEGAGEDSDMVTVGRQPESYVPTVREYNGVVIELFDMTPG
jgi:hypothetical protein